MVYRCLEEYFRRSIWVIGRVDKCKFEGEILVWCTSWAGERGVPFGDVGVGWKGRDAWRRRHHEIHELGLEAADTSV